MADRAVEIKAALEGFERSMEKKRAALPPAGKKALYLWADGALGKFKVDRLSGGGGGLKVVSGDLRRSFQHRESGEALGDLKSVLFTTSKYAAPHEFSATIRPKKGQFLAIPIKGGPATRASGEPLYHSPLRQTLPQQLDFFVEETASGSFVLMDETGKAWFNLVKKVFIPARMRFRETIKAQILQLQERLKARFGEALKSG